MPARKVPPVGGMHQDLRRIDSTRSQRSTVRRRPTCNPLPSLDRVRRRPPGTVPRRIDRCNSRR